MTNYRLSAVGLIERDFTDALCETTQLVETLQVFHILCQLHNFYELFDVFLEN